MFLLCCFKMENYIYAAESINLYNQSSEDIDLATEHEHKYTKGIVEATCVEQGYTRYYCSCGKEFRLEFTPLADHIFGNYTILYEPTETSSGKRIRKCINCEAVEYEEIPILAHTHKYTKEIISPTCMNEGVMKLNCLCGDTMEVPIPATGHCYTETKIYQFPTELQEGILQNICH